MIISDEPRDQLARDLADLYAVKLALILVPVRRLLNAVDRQELADAMSRLVGNISTDVHAVLSRYEIKKTHEQHSSRGESPCSESP
jgi:hypothetical protein